MSGHTARKNKARRAPIQNLYRRTNSDGYVEHEAFVPAPMLFRHFVEQARGLTGSPAQD